MTVVGNEFDMTHFQQTCHACNDFNFEHFHDCDVHNRLLSPDALKKIVEDSWHYQQTTKSNLFYFYTQFPVMKEMVQRHLKSGNVIPEISKWYYFRFERRQKGKFATGIDSEPIFDVLIHLSDQFFTMKEMNDLQENNSESDNVYS